MNRVDPVEFENEVRNVARALWPSSQYSGSLIVDGKERDGIFPTEFVVHIIEATALGTKEKAEKDVKKIYELMMKLQKTDPTRTYQGWFITLHEPLAEQREIVLNIQKNLKHGIINALSYDQFRGKLIDTHQYLEARKTYKFGSIADPETGNTNHEPEYIPLGLTEKNNGALWEIAGVSRDLKLGKKFVLLGDYGAGKSMTLRQLYKELVRAHDKDHEKHFPIFINLRDHQNQTDPVEALHRHSKLIGFPKPDQLVRAWRAGYAIVLLDGFDEIARAGWTAQLKQLRQARFNALALVRDFISQTPINSGVVVTGRQHFFDGDSEMKSALGAGSFVFLTLSEFTDEQITQYLRRHGWSQSIPNWLPARPLLLGYLASKNLLLETLTNDLSANSAIAWDTLLDRISERESKIDVGIDGDYVRRIIERIATYSRRYLDGIGPISSSEIARAYKEVCHFEPDDRGMLLLQRLPGLGAADSEDGTRQMIDTAFADAARVGDVVRFVRDPFNFDLGDTLSWNCLLNDIGIMLAGYQLERLKVKPSQLEVAINQATKKGNSAIVFDILRSAHENCLELPGFQMQVNEIFIPSLEINPRGTSLSNVAFNNCAISLLDLPPELSESQIPTFTTCLIGTIENRVGVSDIPREKFINTEISNFAQSVDTTAQILSLPLSPKKKVLLTILKKVFFQKGSGRKESALHRGLDGKLKRYVPELLKMLEGRGLIASFGRHGEKVWIPVRGNTSRVFQILSAPTTNTDDILRDASLE